MFVLVFMFVSVCLCVFVCVCVFVFVHVCVCVSGGPANMTSASKSSGMKDGEEGGIQRH